MCIYTFLDCAPFFFLIPMLPAVIANSAELHEARQTCFFLRHFIFKSIMSVTCEEANVRLFFSVSVEIKSAETNEDAAGVWLKVVSLFFFPSPFCVCGVVFFFCCGHNKTTDGTGGRRKHTQKKKETVFK